MAADRNNHSIDLFEKFLFIEIFASRLFASIPVYTNANFLFDYFPKICLYIFVSFHISNQNSDRLVNLTNVNIYIKCTITNKKKLYFIPFKIESISVVLKQSTSRRTK